MSVTNQIIQPALTTEYEDLPENTVAILKTAIMDSIGIGYLGYQANNKCLVEYGRSIGGVRESTVIGGNKTSACLAATINTQMAADSNFEETGPGVHAFVPICMTALAVGEKAGSSGRSIMATIAACYELNGHFVRSLKKQDSDFIIFPSNPRRHLPMVLSIGTGKLLGYSLEEINRAVGYSWFMYTPPDFSLTLSRLGGEAGYRMCPPAWCCQSGIQAALLSKTCGGGPPDVLDRVGDTIYDLDNLKKSRNDFFSLEAELCLKPWIGSYGFMGGIELLNRIISHNNIKPGDIKKITFRGSPAFLNELLPFNKTEPKTYWQTACSIPWSFANVILGYPPGIDWVTKEARGDQNRLEIARKVSLEAGKEDENEIELATNDRIFRDSIAWQDFPGGPKRRMTQEECERKFTHLSSAIIGKRASNTMVQMLSNFEEIDDIRELTKYFKLRRV